MNSVNEAVEFYFNALRVLVNLQQGLVQGAVERMESGFKPVKGK
jgi:hypothetical protein